MKPHTLILPVLIGGTIFTATTLDAQDAGTGAQLPAGTTLGEIPADTLDIPAYDLDEFVISVKKDVVRTDGANLTYDLEADDSTKGQTLLEALRKIPMVTVDGKDQIYIKGNSNIKILVNGREDKMLESNASTVFKTMPADAVASIEVITEPGAKYDAEGVGGILNLVTERKQRQYGYSGSVSAGVSSQMYFANLLGSLKHRNFNADANVSYSNNAGLSQTNISNSDSYSYLTPSAYLQSQESRQKVSFWYMSADLNMSWQPNEANLFSWGGSYMDMHAGLDDCSSLTSVYSDAGELMSGWRQLLTGKISNSSATAHASWRHDFDDAGQRLILAYGFNYGKNRISADSENTGILNYSDSAPWQSNLSTNYTREHTVQLDYSNPFGGRTHLLETGLKGIFRRNSAFGQGETGASADAPAPDGVSLVNASQMQDILAVYAAYTGNFDHWSTSAGLRYEHTRMGMDFHLGDYDDFRTNLDDVVPNASVSYLFSPAHTIRLAYNMRISRPGIEQVNPYRLVLSNQVKEGNPDLRSERQNTVSLSYSNFGRILGGSVTASYARTANTIESYSEYRDGILYDGFGNFGVKQRTELTAFLNINILSQMQLSLNGGLNYTDIRDPKSGRGNHGWGGNWGANWSYTAPYDIKLAAYGGQGFRNITISGYYGGWYYYGLSVSRDFLRDKNFNVALNANNFLQKHSSFHSEQWGEGWRRSDRSRYRSWNVGVTLTWKFGKLQEKAKTSGLDISSDDRVSGGKSSGGGQIGF